MCENKQKKKKNYCKSKCTTRTLIQRIHRLARNLKPPVYGNRENVKCAKKKKRVEHNRSSFSRRTMLFRNFFISSHISVFIYYRNNLYLTRFSTKTCLSFLPFFLSCPPPSATICIAFELYRLTTPVENNT